MSKVYTDNIEKRTGGTAMAVPATGKWPTANIADDAITATQIAADAVGSSEIAAGAVGSSEIAANAVTLTELEDGTQGDVLYYGASGAPTRLGFGTSGDFLKTQGTGANPVWATVASSGLNSVQIFTSSGDWTRPSGITKVIIQVQGGGGGGGYRPTGDPSYISAASAGGYALKFLDVSSISTATIVVGIGGTAVNGGGSAADGVNGGNSSWADGTNTITGNFGLKGGYDAGTRWGKIGGVSSGGDINIPGGVGKGQGDYRMEGGDSMLGKGGWLVAKANEPESTWGNSQTTRNGTGYGSGGAAGWGGNPGYTPSGNDSGTGGPGIVIVWEYK